MPAITLPDGSVRRYDNPVSGADIAKSIGAGLAKAALAVKVDGEMIDLARTIDRDARVEIVTGKNADALDLLRHDAAHVLAEAAKELYGEKVQVTFGPSIENGFYYDFHREEPFTPEDLAALEKRMHEIVDRDEPITRDVWSRDDAVAFFEKIGERFKAEHISTIPADEDISIYSQGKFTDLCTGPHLPSTGKLGHAFKLMKLAGSYWRGDAKNAQLQRVYGTAWATEDQLKQHLHQLEEAEKRDHRKIGKEMNLFHLQEEAVGSVFWHPNGWTLYRTLERHMRRRLEEVGYVEVKTPQLLDRALWEASGHWEKYRPNMFIAQTEDEKILALKPMNCPGQVQIFRQGLKSYRDLPLRMAEFGSCHRYEPSGSIHGIMRVRAFTQDDGHIFCTEDQITDESVRFCAFLRSIYKDFGFEDVAIKFWTGRPCAPGRTRSGTRPRARSRPRSRRRGLPYTMNPGEGAFYGPKLEFVLRDAIGRDWQCGTLQVDFVMPERLDASYIGEDGAKHRPVMLHRAILGSFERFMGVLIEHYAGRFPMWLAPVQAVVATVTQDGDAYAKDVLAELKKAGLRAEIDLRNEKINYKVREHSLAKVPALLVVGKKEAEGRTVALRRLGGNAQEVLALADVVHKLKEEAAAPSS